MRGTGKEVRPMASKYQMITGMYEHTLEQVTKSPAAWIKCLSGEITASELEGLLNVYFW